MKSVAELKKEITTRLSQSDSDRPYQEATWILEHVLGFDHSKQISLSPEVVAPEAYEKIIKIVFERVEGRPLAQVLGHHDFFGRRFMVNSDVLIPRAETEKIIEYAIEKFSNRSMGYQFLDLGTGSGCIAITLALEFPDSEIVAIDISKEALTVACENAYRFGVWDRILFLHSDAARFFDNPLYSQKYSGRFDLVTSNPPYLIEGDKRIEPAVSKYEPAVALYSDNFGLKAPLDWMSTGSIACREGGCFITEIGDDQGSAIISATTLASPIILKDCYGADRLVAATKRS